MSKKRKNKQQVSTMIKWLIAVLLCTFLFFSIAQKQKSHLGKISIKIKARGDGKRLVSKKQVRDLLSKELGYDISIAKLKQLDLQKLEQALEDDDRINRAEMFIDKHNKLTIGLIQNLPIVRVSVDNGEDYYLDADGTKVPITGEGIRVPVVTGKVDRYVSNFQKRKDHNLNYVLTLSRMLYEDEFLSGLVDQIHMDEEDGIVMIPKLGRKRIILGGQAGLNKKIHKLKSYYEDGILNIGIDRFEQLDLQYDGQIVGTKFES